MTATLQLGDKDIGMYVACPLQILVQDRGLAYSLCPVMLGHCEEPGLSGAGPCQVPVDGRPYIMGSSGPQLGISVRLV